MCSTGSVTVATTFGAEAVDGTSFVVSYADERDVDSEDDIIYPRLEIIGDGK